MSKELTRRDALGALAAAGIASTAGCSSLTGEESTERTEMETMVALGEVLYPSETEVTEEFIDSFLMGRIVDEESYRTALTDGIETLDTRAQEAQGSPFAALSESERVALIEETELRSGDSDAEGSAIERVNYHLIDELLFAFYASPTGGELVGNPNPRGWPGGFGYGVGASQ